MGIILSFLKYIFLSNPIYVPYSQRSGTAYCPPLAQWEYPRPFWFKTLSYRRQASPCSQYAPLRGGTCHSPFSKCFHRSFLMNRIRIADRSLSLQLLYSYHGGCTCRACLLKPSEKKSLDTGYSVFKVHRWKKSPSLYGDKQWGGAKLF